MFHVPNSYRLREGKMGTDDSYGNNGVFIFYGGMIRTIASDGEGWEHVSVSLHNRTPTWKEMCAVKDHFWDEEDCVIQYHPPKSQYVNFHAHCLHLWRPVGRDIETPPTYLIGPK